MSYARFSSESDLYLFEDVKGGWTCQLCLLEEGSYSHSMSTLEEVEQHLLNHIKAGHNVPDHALKRVQKELQEEYI